MKLKHNLLTILMLALASILLIFTACEKDEDEPTNSAPICTITSPDDGAEFNQDETITITVEAIDEDENIQEVKFYVNDIDIGSANSFPYNFNWETSEEDLGSYTIKAEAIDDEQEKASDEITIILGAAPVSSFTADQTNITAGESVSFTDQSTNEPTTFSWAFGDGSTSTKANPTHTYNSAGSYTVELTVTNDYSSDTETKTDYITVSKKWGDGVTDIDGNSYSSVIIGNQEWITENLKTTTYNDGTSIELVVDNTDWYYNTTGAYCWYDNDKAQYAETYGALYNWYAVETGNLCPDGWHVPTDEEWTTLENFLANNGHEGSEGIALKSNYGWSSGHNSYGTDDYGFTALPGGVRGNSSNYMNVGNTGYWWSATEDSATDAWRLRLFYDDSDIDRSYSDKGAGFSVRCLKD
jgi:uncharacterized protein (TIGR02145 family)